jgi:hypothetical protein
MLSSAQLRQVLRLAGLDLEPLSLDLDRVVFDRHTGGREPDAVSRGARSPSGMSPGASHHQRFRFVGTGTPTSFTGIAPQGGHDCHSDRRPGGNPGPRLRLLEAAGRSEPT